MSEEDEGATAVQQGGAVRVDALAEVLDTFAETVAALSDIAARCRLSHYAQSDILDLLNLLTAYGMAAPGAERAYDRVLAVIQYLAAAGLVASSNRVRD